MNAETLNSRQSAALPYVRAWLLGIAALVFCMVIVGGATRLTDSGLSITEWQPLLGAIPPLTEAQWLVALEKYRQIPEYQLVNKGMSLEDFKFIYWWEWAHRFLGRIIGLAFFLPFAYFAVTGRPEREDGAALRRALRAGGPAGRARLVHGGLGPRRPGGRQPVSPGRPSDAGDGDLRGGALGGLRAGPQPPGAVRRSGNGWRLLIIALVLLQVAAGGFVAGLDAGFGYNTWPLMEGALVPQGPVRRRAVVAQHVRECDDGAVQPPASSPM